MNVFRRVSGFLLLVTLVCFCNLLAIPKDTKLASVVINGDLREVRRLLSSGSKANSVDVGGWTQLQLATFFNHPRIVQELIMRGANVNARRLDAPPENDPILMLLTGKQEALIVKKLDKLSGGRLGKLSKLMDTKIFKFCLEQHEMERFRTTGRLPESSEGMQRLLKAPEIDLGGSISSLCKFQFKNSFNQMFSFVRKKIKQKVNLYGLGSYMLVKSLSDIYILPKAAEMKTMYEVLCGIGTSCKRVINKNGRPLILNYYWGIQNPKAKAALHWAAYFGYSDIVNSLLSDDEIAVNCTDSNGYTPLHLAVIRGDVACVRLLLLAGARRDLKNCKGYTPLDYAKIGRYSAIENLLRTYQRPSKPKCGICLEALERKRKVVSVMCGHVLCKDCSGLLRDNKCPMCRADVGWWREMYM